MDKCSSIGQSVCTWRELITDLKIELSLNIHNFRKKKEFNTENGRSDFSATLNDSNAIIFSVDGT